MTTTDDRKCRFERSAGRLVLTVKGKETSYMVEEFDSEVGGRAFCLVKTDGEGAALERYDVLVGSEKGHYDGCSCASATYRAASACKHWKAMAALIAAGKV